MRNDRQLHLEQLQFVQEVSPTLKFRTLKTTSSCSPSTESCGHEVARADLCGGRATFARNPARSGMATCSIPTWPSAVSARGGMWAPLQCCNRALHRDIAAFRLGTLTN